MWSLSTSLCQSEPQYQTKFLPCLTSETYQEKPSNEGEEYWDELLNIYKGMKEKERKLNGVQVWRWKALCGRNSILISYFLTTLHY